MILVRSLCVPILPPHISQLFRPWTLWGKNYTFVLGSNHSWLPLTTTVRVSYSHPHNSLATASKQGQLQEFSPETQAHTEAQSTQSHLETPLFPGHQIPSPPKPGWDIEAEKVIWTQVLLGKDFQGILGQQMPQRQAPLSSRRSMK